MTPEEMTVYLLDIQQKIAHARKHRLHIVANTLRHEAMSAAERFVDPEWADEADEQRCADRDWISEETRQRTRDLRDERVVIDGIAVPF